jgi:mannose-6-phosphate isomerase
VHIDHRPWGRFDLLTLNEQVSVKILTVNPGARLSLQRHEMRDEWWHIMDDGLVVETDGEERQVTAGDRVWIPRGVVHRVRNTEDSVALFVELAFGHFDEDDIERLEDDYARVGKAIDCRAVRRAKVGEPHCRLPRVPVLSTRRLFRAPAGSNAQMHMAERIAIRLHAPIRPFLRTLRWSTDGEAREAMGPRRTVVRPIASVVAFSLFFSACGLRYPGHPA